MSANSFRRWFALCAIAAIPLSPCVAADPTAPARGDAPVTVGPAAEVSRDQQIQRRLEPYSPANQTLLDRLHPTVAGMPANYSILTEAVTADLQTLYVVSNGAVDQNGNPGTYQPTAGAPSQILARRRVGLGGDHARLRLSDFTRMAAVMMPPPVVNPTTGKVYLALYGAQVTGTTSATQPVFPVMVLEIDGVSLQVVRTLTYKPFTVPTTHGTYSEARNAPRYLFMQPDWSAVYTLGAAPSVYDSGTEGSLSWSSLPAFVHKGTNYVQEIVEASGVRAAETAENWTFENGRPFFLPGTTRVLLSGFNKQTGTCAGTLEASMSPGSGLIPVRSLPYLGQVLGTIGSRLYVTNIGNVGSVPLSQLDSAVTYHRSLPSVSWVEDGRQRQVSFGVAAAVASPATGKILMGGDGGVFIYDVATNSGPVDASMIQHPVVNGTTRTKKFIRNMLGGSAVNKVLLRVDTSNSPVSGGIATVSTQYLPYSY